MAKTVVGLFNSMDDARNVQDDLLREGYSRDMVRVVANKTGADKFSEGGESHDEGIGHSIANFFRSLVGANTDEDERYYTEGIRRGGALVMVTVPDERVDAAEAILERHGATDVNEQRGENISAAGTNLREGDTTERSIPVVEEELQVGKRQVQRGGVRVYSHMTETPIEENVRLRDEHVTVERRAADRPATEADLQAFKEGSIELTETSEEPVVSKRARVVEEVVVGRDVSEHTETVRDNVRKTEVEVENLGTNRGGSTGSGVDDDFRQHFNSTYSRNGASWDRYAPAYEYGARLADDPRYRNGDWAQNEASIHSDWTSRGQGAWEDFKAAIRHGWERTKSAATLSHR